MSLIPVEETNLIELRAEGSDPLLLQSAVNAWAKAYEGLRQSQIAQLRAETMAELEDEQAALQLTIQERQEAWASFVSATTSSAWRAPIIRRPPGSRG